MTFNGENSSAVQSMLQQLPGSDRGLVSSCFGQIDDKRVAEKLSIMKTSFTLGLVNLVKTHYLMVQTSMNLSHVVQP